MQEKRIDGLEAMKEMLAPFTGKIRVDRFDMIDPKVQHHGDIAVLTFNLVSYRMHRTGQTRSSRDGTPARCTGRRRDVAEHPRPLVVHQAELKTPVSEEAS